jgi:HSP20 family protein
MGSLTRWEPFEGLDSLQDDMRRLLGSTLARPWWPLESVEQGFTMDMFEKEGNIVIKVALPGVKPEDVQVTAIGNTLTIKGELKAEENVGDKSYIHRERRYGKFSRTVTLPGDVPVEDIQAEFEHGVLTLTVPKADKSKVKKIEVKAK